MRGISGTHTGTLTQSGLPCDGGPYGRRAPRRDSGALGRPVGLPRPPPGPAVLTDYRGMRPGPGALRADSRGLSRRPCAVFVSGQILRPSLNPAPGRLAARRAAPAAPGGRAAALYGLRSSAAPPGRCGLPAGVVALASCVAACARLRRPRFPLPAPCGPLARPRSSRPGGYGALAGAFYAPPPGRGGCGALCLACNPWLTAWGHAHTVFP